MTPPAPEPARRAWVPSLRRASLAVGALAWLAAVAPPVAVLARRYEFVQAAQFSTLAFWAPALLVVGAPWWVLRRGPGGPWVHRRPSNTTRAVATGLAFVVVSILWRVAPAVDALTAHPWLVAVEGVSLTGLGAALMTDLVESPPLRPGISRPYRIGVSAVVMWSAWVVAYLGAMSSASWYPAFRHVAHRSLSAEADQQLATAAIWFMSAVVFVPLIFWNLVHWLQSEEDPDEELHRVVREERARGFFGYRD